MSDETTVIFHFVSGKTYNVSFEKDNFDRLIEYFRKGWDRTSIANDEWGVNLSLVTHYEIKE